MAGPDDKPDESKQEKYYLPCLPPIDRKFRPESDNQQIPLLFYPFAHIILLNSDPYFSFSDLSC